MAQSTVYPEKIKILGNKVYVRNLDSVEEDVDENDNTIYSYDEIKLTKDEFELQKFEQNNLDVKELSLSEKIKTYRWKKQRWFYYDGHLQRFDDYDIIRIDTAMQALERGVEKVIRWEYPNDGELFIKEIQDSKYFINMKFAGFQHEGMCRYVEQILQKDKEVNEDNYKEKFDKLLQMQQVN